MNKSATGNFAPPHVLSPILCSPNALVPVITPRKIGFHYGKHHQGYVNNLNKLVAGHQVKGKAKEIAGKLSDEVQFSFLNVVIRVHCSRLTCVKLQPLDTYY